MVQPQSRCHIREDSTYETTSFKNIFSAVVFSQRLFFSTIDFSLCPAAFLSSTDFPGDDSGKDKGSTYSRTAARNDLDFTTKAQLLDFGCSLHSLKPSC